MKTQYVDINPELLTWARKRAKRDLDSLVKRFPKLAEWESGKAKPTMRQLESFARALYVPIGHLFLSQPLDEQMPLSDFRTLADQTMEKPSLNLLDTIYLCQQRQEWYREYAKLYKIPKVKFIGSATTNDQVATIAQDMREQLKLPVFERKHYPNWTDALRKMIARCESAGIMIMASSIVGSNSHRKLLVEEFRGFSLADTYAPLVFLNAADSKSAQMFTLAHELAHLWLGESGIVNSQAGLVPDQKSERWCNAVAAEFLMPLEMLHQEYDNTLTVPEMIQALSRNFKVSSLVSLRRLHDAGYISREELWTYYQKELEHIKKQKNESGGGDFYRTLGTRTGKLFARAVISSALEGQTLFQEAFRMLGIKKTQTFYNAASELKVAG